MLPYNFNGTRMTDGLANTYHFAENTWQSTGKERDPESGLDYFLARYYSSAYGRFVTIDPLSRSASPPLPQTWNRYTYTLNNPLKFVDPTGQCSAPSGIGSGQVGICIGMYISTRTVNIVGKGDDRGPVGNDPKATFRAQVQLVVDPKKGTVVSAATEAGKSSVLVEWLGRKGTATSTVSEPVRDDKGNMTVTVSTTARNGLAFLPGAPKDSIDMTITLIITPEGRVGVQGGTRDGYPSLEVYAYDFQGNITPVLQIHETNPTDLKPPEEQRIPEIPPQPPMQQ
jgi:RHS repeat-associated protein